jgi:hypothetical protein
MRNFPHFVIDEHNSTAVPFDGMSEDEHNSTAVPFDGMSEDDQVVVRFDGMSEDDQVVVRFDGCCHWTIASACYQLVDEKQDCEHHSKIGYTTQHYSSGDFKDDPLAFVTTIKQLRETLERYKTDDAYSKKKCTIGANQTHDFNFFKCGEGRGYEYYTRFSFRHH